MKFSRHLKSILLGAACLCFSLPLLTRADISVTPTGAGPITFGVAPVLPDWSTVSLAGAGNTYLDVAALTAGVQALTAPLAEAPPSDVAYTAHGRGYWNSAALNLFTRPTGNAASVLAATLHNDAGGDITSITVSYTLGENTYTANGEGAILDGHIVYYSLTGAANSWVQLPGAPTGPSAVRTGTPVSFTLDLSATHWTAGTRLFLLFADDNGNGNTDAAYTIDDFAITSVVTSGGTVPLSVTLTAPANGAVVSPGPVTITANAVGTTPPIEVIFYANGSEVSRDSTAPYSAILNATAGTYAIYAEAYNAASEIADSATVTITVREEFVLYTGGVLSQNFDSMGSAGTEAPIGWYVGAALPANSYTVTAGDGSAGANGAILGWNYGTSGSGERALGTAPTGADRNMVARLKNNTSSNITAFAFHYDGEVWRNYTNDVDGYLTNFVSYDLGSTWVPTAFDFGQPTPRVEPQGAVDGNAAGNRTANIGGTVTPSAPIPPGGVIYIRWQDFNGAGVTDGGLAIDNFTFQGTGFSQAVLGVTITSPTSGQAVGAACTGGATVTTSATASPGGANTITNVSFKLDAGTATNDTTSPYSVTFANVAVGPHTILATAKDSSGGTISSSVNFSVVANQPAVINYSNVFSGSQTGLTFLVGTPITNQFGITDDTGVASVDFLVNGTVLYSTNLNYGMMVVNDALAGTSTYTVRATDLCGNVSQQSKTITVTNPPVSIVVSNGSSWKYNGTGAAPANDGGGKAWNAVGYDDSTWASGFAELGYGDAVTPPGTNPERTPIDIGPAGARYHAVYFRRTFSVANPSAFTTLVVNSLNDDGSAVYLNGNLVATFNMTNGVGVPIVYNDFAGPYLGIPGAVAHDGTVYSSSNIVNSLVAGVNTLAVEVHQDAANSSDLSFDLMLWGTGTSGPHLNIALEGVNVRITWSGGGTLQYTDNMSNTPVWADQIIGFVSPGNYLIPHTAAHRFYSLRP
ncbi:MAG: hypothetical protein QOF48_2360 [Verrucomicrobiota bacterium]